MIYTRRDMYFRMLSNKRLGCSGIDLCSGISCSDCCIREGCHSYEDVPELFSELDQEFGIASKLELI